MYHLLDPFWALVLVLLFIVVCAVQRRNMERNLVVYLLNFSLAKYSRFSKCYCYFT